MKKLFFILSILISTVTIAQVDTVCYRTSGSIYQVTNTPGYTYTWTVTPPGIITGGQGTNIINVNWSNANAGLITNGVSVFATNANNCTTSPVTLNVLILNIIPAITSIGPFCVTEPCTTLNATPNGGTWSGVGVNGNLFCPTIAGSGSQLVTYTINQGGCVFSTNTTITINPIPTISPISHN